jgi:L-ascorbate metabolism protein UlaG (beta-lactamase superfamily)
MTENQTDASAPVLRATFIGVTTILFDNGIDSVLIDGFFSRPSLFSTIFWNIQPDEKKVLQCMERAGIDQRLKAVLVAHSHYDHALDAPIVCQQTGATLVGSSSTQMIGKGHGLPDHQMMVVEDGQVLTFGPFRVTIFEGIHSPGDLSPGDIEEPLHTPCGVNQFKTGKCYSYLIEHHQDRIFVHPSANFIPGKLKEFNASTLFLGVGIVGKQSEEFRKDYWEHVVSAIDPKKIIPIHWDNFWRSIDLALSPMPWFADKWSITDRYLKENSSSNDIDLQFLQAWETITI